MPGSDPDHPKPPPSHHDQPTLPAGASGWTSADQPTQPTVPNRSTPSDMMTRATLPAGSSPTQVTHLHVENPGAPRAPGTHHGQIWGDFQLGDLLGKGGMGAVYRGRQISLDRDVAIKVLPPHLSGNPDFRTRFQIEAKAVARIQSPHVIQVYAAGEFQGNHYFAMEFVEGSDLSGHLKKGWKPSHREALDLIRQAARGLAAAGEHGIIHRDIKPANMMITRKGELKLMDFGLAKLASGETGLTMAGTIMGTVNYFSPEQGRGETCDCRTDIYALGIVFYELLTGRLPFTGQDATSIIYQHIHQEPRAPKEIDPSIPDPYQAVVLKCMQKAADDRYQTAQDLLDDLDALREGRMPQTALTDPQGLRAGGAVVRKEPFASEKKKGKGGLIAVLVVLAAGAGGGGYWWWQRQQAQQTPTSTPVATPTRVTTTDPVTTVAPPKQPTLVVPDVTPARAHLAAGRWAEARALAQAALADFPANEDWKVLASEVDAAEGKGHLAQAEKALEVGAYDQADAALGRARGLVDRSEIDALAGRIAAARATVGARETLLQRARSVEAAVAEGLLVAWVTDHPDDLEVRRELAAVRERLTLDTERRTAALEQIANGRKALERKDLDAALIAFSAALQHLPSSKEASDGIKEVTAIKEQVATVRARFTEALKAKDLAGATAALDELRAILPGSAQVLLAENELEQSRLKQQAEARARSEAEAALDARIQTLLGRIGQAGGDDQELIAAVEAQSKELAADDARRDQLQRALGDRAARKELAAALAALDQAVLAGDEQALAQRVVADDLRGRLLKLHDYSGLVFASTLKEVLRSGDSAVVTVAIRHALDLFPERELVYRLECRRGDHGWTVTAATREAP